MSRPDDGNDPAQEQRSGAAQDGALAAERWATEVLGLGPDEAPAVDFAQARAAFAALAASNGVVDVAFEAHESPFGPLLVGATQAGVVRVALPIEDEAAVLGQLATRISPRVMRMGSPSIAQARRQLDEYFLGGRRTFDVPLDWHLTAGFRRDVLQATAQIPYGETASYGAVATRAGSPKAVRAAGSALATNPLPILVPCHRVVRTGGALGQYLGGVQMKSGLLALEQNGRGAEA